MESTSSARYRWRSGQSFGEPVRLRLFCASITEASRTNTAALSMSAIADALSGLLGRAVTYQHRSPAEQREKLLASGLSEFVADLLLGLDRIFHESVLAETTSTVRELTGHAPRQVTDWLSDNIALFRK